MMMTLLFPEKKKKAQVIFQNDQAVYRLGKNKEKKK